MSFNPFAEAEGWGDNNYIPEGLHLAQITEPEDVSASTGNPQIKILFKDKQGRTLTDYCAYHETFLAKVVDLFDAAGLDRPGPGEFDPQDHCRISVQKIAKLSGKWIGIRVANEPSIKDPSKSYARVQSYLDGAQVNSDIPAATVQTGSSASKANEDIPF